MCIDDLEVPKLMDPSIYKSARYELTTIITHCQVDYARAAFSNVVFGTWDQRVTQPKGISWQKKETIARLRWSLAARDRKAANKRMQRRDRINLTAVRIAVNAFALVCLTLTATGIYFLVAEGVPTLKDINGCEAEDNDFVCLMFEYLPSMAVTLANLVLPLLFSMLIVYERYEANVELIINLTRCILLRLASLAIAFYSVYFTVKCDYRVRKIL